MMQRYDLEQQFHAQACRVSERERHQAPIAYPWPATPLHSRVIPGPTWLVAVGLWLCLMIWV